MATPLPYPENPEPVHAAPEPTPEQTDPERQMRRTIVAVSIGGILLLVLLIAAIIFLLLPSTSGEWVGKLRDVFIIVVALESLVIGVALVVLVVQLASLINLLQNEVRPILKATNETVNNLRGTAEFLGENMVEPVIKLNGYMAGLNRMLELMGIRKK